MLYNAVVKPHIEYGCTLWSYENLTSIIKAQKRAVRTLTPYKNYIAHTKPVMARFNLLSVEDLIKQKTCVFVLKSIREQLPHGKASLIKLTQTTKKTRTSDKLMTQKNKGIIIRDTKRLIVQGTSMWKCSSI
jgi:hypothetical protein